MTTERRDVNTTEQHEQMVEAIVRDIFDALDVSDSEAEGGQGSEVDAVLFDLKRLSPQELEDQLWAAERIVEGLINSAEAISATAQAVFTDCHNRVLEAHRRAMRAVDSQ